MKEKLEALLFDLAAAYDISDIRQLCIKHDRSWHYSLLTTALEIEKPLIIGFNWGATKGVSYSPQKNIESVDFLSQDLGSLRRTVSFFNRYLNPDQINNASQTNYCLFRSQKEDQITPRDIELCQPIFKRLIEILQPSYVVCFSSQLKKKLISLDLLEKVETKDISSERGSKLFTYTASKGYLKGVGEIYFLPHPNYPLSGKAREEAWQFNFGNG